MTTDPQERLDQIKARLDAATPPVEDPRHLTQRIEFLAGKHELQSHATADLAALHAALAAALRCTRDSVPLDEHVQYVPVDSFEYGHHEALRSVYWTIADALGGA